MLVWKNMTRGDVQHVLAIADVVHTDYPESRAVYEERLALFPAGCWVAVNQYDVRATPAGYAITHPGVIGQPPPLDALLGTLPVHADCLYVHDVAILPQSRQGGLGGSIIAAVALLAKEHALMHMALIAVNNSAPYWQKKGFNPYQAADDALLRKLKSYSDDAQYLVMSSG